MSEPSYEGGCLCGAVRLRVGGPVTNLCYCHCRSCRRASGAPLVAWGTFPLSKLELTVGELTEHRSSEKVVRGFCGACGTSLTYLHEGRPDFIDVALATLDEPRDLAPQCHIWMADKLPWLDPGDGLPQYDEWRPKGA